MSSSYLRIVNNTLFLYFRQLIVLAIGLFTTRLTLKLLGISDFGIFAAVAGVTSLLGVLTKALTSGTQRFITIGLGKGDIRQLNRIYVTSVHVHLIVSCILIILGETLGVWFLLTQMTLPEERLWVAFWVFQISLLNSVLALINVPNNAEIVAHEDMGVTAFIAVAEVVLKLVAVFLLFFISWDKLLFYAIALFVLQFANRAFCVYYCKIHYEEVHYHFVWDKPLLKSMLQFSGWMGLSNMAVTGYVQGVNILLNIFFGPMMNAAYGVAMQAYSGIRTFCSNFQLASNPQLVKLYASGELDRMHRLLFSVCKMSFYLIFVLSLPFLVYADFILQLWLGRVPEHAVSFLSLLLIYAYIDVMAYPLDIAAGATGNLRKYSTLISVFVLSTLPLAYFAYTMGAEAETIYYIAICISWICLAIRISLLGTLIKLNRVAFFTQVIMRSAIVALLTMSIPVCFRVCTSYCLVNVILGFIIAYFVAVPVLYFIGLNHSERTLAIGFVKSVANRIYGKQNSLS